MGHLHRLSKKCVYELRNCGGCGRFVQGMTEIEAERGGKCKMQPKLLLIAALLSWPSSSVTYASTITVFNDFGPATSTMAACWEGRCVHAQPQFLS
jgi:hypothetical protein